MPARDNRSSSSYSGPPPYSSEERDYYYRHRRTGAPAAPSAAYRSPADPYLHPAFLPDPSRPLPSTGYAAPYGSSNFFPSRQGPTSDPAQFGLARSSRQPPPSRSPPPPRPPPRPRSPHRPRSPSPYTADQLRDQRAYRPPTATMSTDYQAYLEATSDLSRMTVDRLKRATRGINQALATNMRLSGKKNDLYTALLDTLAIEYDKPDKTRFYTCRRYISEAKLSPNPNGPTWSLPAASTSTGYNAGYNGYGQRQAPAAAAAAAATATNGYGAAAGSNAGASTSTYNPAAAGLPAPRFGNAYAQATTAATPSWQAPRADEPPIRFRPSPFYRVEKALSSVATLIKAGPGDRKIATVRFKLTEPQLELLRKSKEAKSNPQYEVRLYCTSDTNYNQIRPQAHQFPAPIEFPAACEVKLNNVLVPANTKGIKKQPGTAPPVNLSGAKGPAVSTTSSDVTHTIDLIYTNTDKVYYIVAYLIEYTPIDKIVGRVKTGKTRSKEEVIQGIVKLNDDPDVEASAFGLSLKDPLSYTRIETPIRSVHCQHIACFDAVTWFEINEQTPQWMCPICNKPLKVEDMVVDGYLEDILKICSSSVDSVTVEPDGTWRSDNDKFGTAKPRIAASTSTSVRNSPTPSTTGGDKKPFSGGSGSGSGNGGGRQAVTLELDSDSGDDEPLAKRPRLNGYSSFGGGGGGGGGGGSSTPGGGRTGTGTPLSATNEILDLTLSSDDEGAPPPPPQRSTSATTSNVPPHRPSIAMARTGSSEQKKGLEDVQRDIAAMNERMRRDYGENWRDQFGLHGAPPPPPHHTGLPSPGPGT